MLHGVLKMMINIMWICPKILKRQAWQQSSSH